MPIWVSVPTLVSRRAPESRPVCILYSLTYDTATISLWPALGMQYANRLRVNSSIMVLVDTLNEVDGAAECIS
jgi:hypothetical protein